MLAEQNDASGNGSNLRIDLEINALKASKNGDKSDSGESVKFKVDAKLEEISRKQNEVTVDFGLIISTEPAAAKFEIEGKAKIEGEVKDIDKVIAEDKTTQVPLLISEIYSRVYSMLFMMASGIGIQYPGAGLLYADTKILQGKINSSQESPKKTDEVQQAEEVEPNQNQ